MPEWLSRLQAQMSDFWGKRAADLNEWAAKFGTKVGDFVNNTNDKLMKFGDKVGDFVDKAGDKVMQLGDKMYDIGGDVAAKGLEAVKGVPEEVTKQGVESNKAAVQGLREKAKQDSERAVQEHAPTWDEWKASQTSAPSYTQKMTEYNDKMAATVNNNKFNQALRDTGKSLLNTGKQMAKGAWEDIKNNGIQTVGDTVKNVAGGVGTAIGNTLVNSLTAGGDQSGEAEGMRNVAALFETQDAPAYQMAAQQNQAEANRNYRAEAEKDANAQAANQQAQNKANMSAAAGVATAALSSPAVAQADYAGKKQIQLQQRQQAVSNLAKQFDAQRQAAGLRANAKMTDYSQALRNNRNSQTARLAMGQTDSGTTQSASDTTQQNQADSLVAQLKNMGYTVDESGVIVPPAQTTDTTAANEIIKKLKGLGYIEEAGVIAPPAQGVTQ